MSSRRVTKSVAAPPRPLRGEVFADPAARVVWAAIESLPDASKHAILTRLRDLLACVEGTSTGETRARRAVVALREAAELLGGRSPSVEEYRRLRVELAERERAWPPDGTLRSWLGGGWNDCLRAAHLEGVVDGDVVVASLGPAFTCEEVLDALRECARDLAVIPTISAYFQWARRPDVRARPGRRPTSLMAFQRVFGGYKPAVLASGLVEGASENLPRSTVARYASYKVTPEGVQAALREVATMLGRSPRLQEYTTVREQLLTAMARDGVVRAMPAATTIQKLYGIWDDALKDAGLEPTGGRHTRSNPYVRRKTSSKRVTNEEILAVIREAYETVGDPFTMAAYTAWRKEQIERDRATRRMRHLPHCTLTITRFGRWRNGIAAALSGQTDNADELNDERANRGRPGA